MQVFIQGNACNEWWLALDCQFVPIMKCIENEADTNFVTKFKDSSKQEFSSTVKFVSKEECYIVNNDTKMKRVVLFYSGRGEFPRHDGPVKV